MRNRLSLLVGVTLLGGVSAAVLAQTLIIRAPVSGGVRAPAVPGPTITLDELDFPADRTVQAAAGALVAESFELDLQGLETILSLPAGGSFQSDIPTDSLAVGPGTALYTVHATAPGPDSSLVIPVHAGGSLRHSLTIQTAASGAPQVSGSPGPLEHPQQAGASQWRSEPFTVTGLPPGGAPVAIQLQQPLPPQSCSATGSTEIDGAAGMWVQEAGEIVAILDFPADSSNQSCGVTLTVGEITVSYTEIGPFTVVVPPDTVPEGLEGDAGTPGQYHSNPGAFGVWAESPVLNLTGFDGPLLLETSWQSGTVGQAEINHNGSGWVTPTGLEEIMIADTLQVRVKLPAQTAAAQVAVSEVLRVQIGDRFADFFGNTPDCATRRASCQVHLEAGCSMDGTLTIGTVTKIDKDTLQKFTGDEPLWCDMTTDGGGWTLVHKTNKTTGNDRTENGHNTHLLQTASLPGDYDHVAVLSPDAILEIDDARPPREFRVLTDHPAAHVIRVRGGGPLHFTDTGVAGHAVDVGVEMEINRNGSWIAANTINNAGDQHGMGVCPDGEGCSGLDIGHFIPWRLTDFGYWLNGTSFGYPSGNYYSGTAWVR